MARPSLSDNLVRNAAQLEQRRQLGDHLDVPRRVEHSGTFRTKRSAATAASELRQLGYEVELRPVPLRTMVEAKKMERLDEDEPNRFVAQIFDVFDRNKGTYGGWGGTIVTPDTQR